MPRAIATPSFRWAARAPCNVDSNPLGRASVTFLSKPSIIANGYIHSYQGAAILASAAKGFPL